MNGQDIEYYKAQNRFIKLQMCGIIEGCMAVEVTLDEIPTIEIKTSTSFGSDKLRRMIMSTKNLASKSSENEFAMAAKTASDSIMDYSINVDDIKSIFARIL